MPWIPYNPNPRSQAVGDCAIRAVAKATDQSWQAAYSDLVIQGYRYSDLPNANYVWGSYLRRKGFKRALIPDSCPDCYTIADFAYDHPKGMYVVSTGNHVVAVNDGDYFDSWDSGNEAPIMYWYKEDK